MIFRKIVSNIFFLKKNYNVEHPLYLFKKTCFINKIIIYQILLIKEIKKYYERGEKKYKETQ